MAEFADPEHVFFDEMDDPIMGHRRPRCGGANAEEELGGDLQSRADVPGRIFLDREHPLSELLRSIGEYE